MKRILFALAAAAALVGCTKEADLIPDEIPVETVTVTATVQPEISRAAFANDQTFMWQAGDVIGVNAGGTIVPFTLQSGAGSASGTFTGSVPSGKQVEGVAFYPNNEGSSYANGTLSLALPQFYTSLSDFSEVRMPMAAKLEAGAQDFAFYNVGGVVKLTLKDVPAEAKYFKLTADKPINGTFTVAVSGIGSGATLTYVSSSADDPNAVELQLSAGKAAETLDIYFPVPPGTYTLGVGVYGDGTTYLVRTATKTNTISRGTILRMPALEIPKPVEGDSEWSLIGSMTSWAANIGMNLDGDWSVVRTVSLTTSDEFKFRKGTTWAVNLGSAVSNPQVVSLDTRVALSQDGGNLKVSAAGTYDLWLNPLTECCYILTAGSSFNHKDDENPDPGPYNPDLDPSQKLSGLMYQLNVYSFAPLNPGTNAQGKFMGIINHLDYLDKLGVTAIWLSPIQTAQSYHGYDVTDYEAINTNYGVEQAFQMLIQEAHKRNIRVYMDYVINHTGDNHKWFNDVKKNGPSSQYWNYYSISADPQADVNAGNIAQIPQGWYNSGEWWQMPNLINGTQYYYHTAFGTGVFVDLNYYDGGNCENSPAFKAIVASLDKWLAMGVDGLRLDAVKHIYTINDSNEGKMWDNIQFWKKFYDAVNAKYKQYASARADLAGTPDQDIFMVGEVLSGDFQCTPFYEGLPAIFEFDFWWQLRTALQNENSNYFVDNMVSRYNAHKNVRSSAIATPKLSNHDENRVGEELGQYLPKMKQAGAILLTAPGRPVVYQGEELGYWGSKLGGDEYVRAPILWTKDLKSAALGGVNGKYDSNMLDETHSVAYQEQHDDSILMMYRHFGYARNTNPALADGWPEANDRNTGTILSWYMHANDGSGKVCLVIHNISSTATQNVSCPYDNLSSMLVSNGNVSVSGTTVTMGPCSSVVFALN